MSRSVRLLGALLAASVFGCGGATPGRPDPNPAGPSATLPDVCLPPGTAPSARVTPSPVHTGVSWVLADHVLTATGDRFEPGWVRLVDGRIDAVGAGGPDGIAPDDDRHDHRGTGAWITPGIIDAHSHLGVYATPSVPAHSDGNEATSPNTAQVRAVESVWPQDPGFERAVRGGVTALHVLPGSANLIGGRGVTLRPWPGMRSAEDMRMDGAPDSLKMACGENPKRVYGQKGGPATRMGSLASMRQAWSDASNYRRRDDQHRDKLRAWCDEGAPADRRPEPPNRDLRMETMVGVLRGEILPQVHCYRADEMLAQIGLADEFGYTIRAFHHAVEAYKIRDVLADRNIATATWADWWGFKFEAWDTVLETPALLTESGAIAVVHSDSEIGIQRLNQEAGKALAAARRAGIDVDEHDALRWITANPAWALGIDDRTGTLEPGKAADLVVWTGYPLSAHAVALQVFVEGSPIFDRRAPTPPWSDFEADRSPLEAP